MMDPFRNIWKKKAKPESATPPQVKQSVSLKEYVEQNIEAGKVIPVHGHSKSDLCLHYGDTEAIVAIDWGKQDATQRIYEILPSASGYTVTDKGFLSTGDAYIDYIESWAKNQKHVTINIYDEETNTWETIEEK